MGSVRIGRKYRNHIPNEQVTTTLLEELEKIVLKKTIDAFAKRGEAMAKELQASGNRELKRLAPFIGNQLIGLQSRTQGLDLSPTARRLRRMGNAQQLKRDEGRADATVIPASFFMRGVPKQGKFAAAHPFFDRAGMTAGMPDLRWKPLSLKTVQRKKNSSFFVDKGPLQAFFRTSATDMIMNKTGGVICTFDPAKVNIEKGLKDTAHWRNIFGAIDIKIAPKKVTPYNLKALGDGAWNDANTKLTLEKGLFPLSIAKRLGLQGGKGEAPPWFRPMVQPAMAFWLLHRIPRAMGATLFHAMQKFKGGGVGMDVESSGGGGGRASGAA